MTGIKWMSILAVVAVIGLASAAPVDNSLDDLNPLSIEGSDRLPGLEREKRKLPEAAFASKNAVLGFVFGKIDNLIDAKTRFVDQLDKQNIAKNKAAGIEVPKPITSFQSLISAVITPKVQAITSKFGHLSGFIGGASGGGLSAGHGSAEGGAGQSAGIGNILTSFLRLSGPILSGSSGGAQQNTSDDFDDDEDDV